MFSSRTRLTSWLSLVALVVYLMCLAAGLSDRARAEGAFDGVYKGTLRTTVSDNWGYCSFNKNDYTIVIQNNHFTEHWAGPLEVDVASDGTFEAARTRSGSPYPSEIKGKIVGNKLEADIGTVKCVNHISLNKS